jgi:hypothetical protein
MCGDYKVCKNWLIFELFASRIEHFAPPPKNQVELEFGRNFTAF